MGNLDDKEPKLQSYLDKEYNDDETKRINIVKEETQIVDSIKEEISETYIAKEETQQIDAVKEITLNSNNTNAETQKIVTVQDSAEINENKTGSTEKSENIKQEKNKKEKKPVTLKRIIVSRIIFIIVFTVTLLSITLYLANKKGSNVLENITNKIDVLVNNDENKVNEKEKTVDLNGTYDINPIDFRTYTFEYLENKIEYIQIDGLKDESVEIKINNEIKSSIEEVAKKFCEENQKSEIYNGCTVHANFANVISLSYSISTYYGEYVSKDLYFNYDLVNGNSILLDDIFSSDFAIENVLVDELYEAVTEEYSEADEETWELYVPEDAGDIEEIVYSIVSDYQRGKKIDFYFTANTVHVRAGSYSYAIILFNDYAKYVTIYDKYLTSNYIYDGQYKEITDLPNLTNMSYWGDIELYIEEEGKDYYLNVGLFIGSDITAEKVIETVSNYVKEYVNQKKYEQRPDGMFTLYNAKFYIWEYGNSEYNVECEEYSYETTKSKFTHSIKPKINEFLRQEFSDWPEVVGNGFLARIYDDEIINDENLKGDYYNMTLDSIGNIIEIDGKDVNLGIND